MTVTKIKSDFHLECWIEALVHFSKDSEFPKFIEVVKFLKLFLCKGAGNYFKCSTSHYSLNIFPIINSHANLALKVIPIPYRREMKVRFFSHSASEDIQTLILKASHVVKFIEEKYGVEFIN